MSRFRRPFQDNLADVMYDLVTTGMGANSPEAVKARMEVEAMRLEARKARRLQREAAGRRRLVAVGAGLLAGGLGSVTLPVVAAVGLGLLAGGVVYYVVGHSGGVFAFVATAGGKLKRLLGADRPKEIRPPEVSGADLPKSRKELIQRVLDETAQELKRLEAVARAIKDMDKDGAGLCARMVAAGERLSDAVANDPGRFDVAQRVLTYHLPKAAYVAETFLDQSKPGATTGGRAQEARQLLVRMEMLVEKTLLDLQGVDEAEMNLEMRLINQALDEELGSKRP